MRLVCISDTHGLHDKMLPMPEGDVLIHSGDCTGSGTLDQVHEFAQWMGEQPHAHKILVAGNHDYCFDRKLRGSSMSALSRELCQQNRVTYLRGESISIRGMNFFGFPWQPIFRHMAFNAREAELRGRLKLVPENTHVLISHGPAYGILDFIPSEGKHVGCHALANRIEQLPNLMVHACGHIHESYGFSERQADGLKFVNASICTDRYKPTNNPIILDL